MNCLTLKKNNSKTKGSYLYLKEGAFLERVETAVRDGVKESVPMAMK